MNGGGRSRRRGGTRPRTASHPSPRGRPCASPNSFPVLHANVRRGSAERSASCSAMGRTTTCAEAAAARSTAMWAADPSASWSSVFAPSSERPSARSGGEDSRVELSGKRVVGGWRTAAGPWGENHHRNGSKVVTSPSWDEARRKTSSGTRDRAPSAWTVNSAPPSAPWPVSLRFAPSPSSSKMFPCDGANNTATCTPLVVWQRTCAFAGSHGWCGRPTGDERARTLCGRGRNVTLSREQLHEQHTAVAWEGAGRCKVLHGAPRRHDPPALWWKRKRHGRESKFGAAGSRRPRRAAASSIPAWHLVPAILRSMASEGWSPLIHQTSR